MEKGELIVEQKRGIITLLSKKGKNRLFLKNWRPISLLNNDYNVIAILAMRLQLVLLNIINDDQSGYLKGRYIGQNIRILEDVSFLLKKTNYLIYYFPSTSKRLLTLLTGTYSIKL